MSGPPDVTSIERFTLRPGDRLVLRCDQPLTYADVDTLKARLRAGLALADDVPIVVLGSGMSLAVVDAAEPLPDAAITAAMVDAFIVAIAKAAAVPGATAGDCYRAGLEAAAPALRAQGAAAERARIAQMLLDDGWPRMQLERLGLLDGDGDG